MTITTRHAQTKSRVFLGGAVESSAYVNVTNQNVPYTDTAASSGIVSAATTQVVVTLTTNGFIAIGTNPIATTSGIYLPAYVPSLPIQVSGGVSKISAIRADYKDGDMLIAEYS